MNQISRIRLSAMMFFYYFSMGAAIPVMTLYFKDSLGFSGIQTGQILAMSALSVFLAPLLTAFVAYKYLSSEKLFSVSQLISGGLLLLVIQLRTFWPVLVFYTLYLIIYNPCATLANAITFHHAADGKNQYGPIRMWGTVGWLAAGLLFGLVLVGVFQLPIASGLYFSAAISLGLGIYGLFLPEPQIQARKRGSILPSESIALFKLKPVLFLVIAGLIAQAVERYYYFGAASFLQAGGVPKQYVVPFMTIGQISEIITLSMGGWLISKWGYKRLIFLGILMELLRFVFFIPGTDHLGLLLAGLICHGLAFTFFFSTAFIYLDSLASPKARSGAHLLFNLTTAGPGQYLGNAAGGFFMDQMGGNYTLFWVPPALFSGFGLIFAGLIGEKKRGKSIPPTPATTVAPCPDNLC